MVYQEVVKLTGILEDVSVGDGALGGSGVGGSGSESGGGSGGSGELHCDRVGLGWVAGLSDCVVVVTIGKWMKTNGGNSPWLNSSRWTHTVNNAPEHISRECSPIGIVRQSDGPCRPTTRGVCHFESESECVLT